MRSAKITVLSLVAAGALLAGCTTRGSGVEAREHRQVAAFNEIHVGGVFDLYVTVGGPRSVEVIGDDNLLPLVETKILGNRLDVGTEGGVSPKRDLTVRVTTPSLERLDISGVADVTVEGLSGPGFELDASGSSDTVLSGKIDRLVLDLSGASSVQATTLTAQHVEADLSGASKAEIRTSDSLTVDASGSSTVRYLGTPSVETDLSGSAQVTALDR